MKKSLLLSAFVFLLSFSAFASEQYVCKEIDRNFKPVTRNALTLVVTQIGSAPYDEGERVPFQLELFEAGSRTPVLSRRVTVVTNDVLFRFSGQGIKGIIYMDELEQTVVTINGREIQFDCNP